MKAPEGAEETSPSVDFPLSASASASALATPKAAPAHRLPSTSSSPSQTSLQASLALYQNSSSHQIPTSQFFSMPNQPIANSPSSLGQQPGLHSTLSLPQGDLNSGSPSAQAQLFQLPKYLAALQGKGNLPSFSGIPAPIVELLAKKKHFVDQVTSELSESRKNQLHLQEGLQRSVFPTQVNPPGSTLQSADIGGGALNDIPSKLRQLQLQQRQLQQLQVHSFSKLSLQQLQQLQQMQQLQQLQPQQGQPTAMSQMQHLSQLQMYSSWNQGLMMLPGSPFHALAKKSKAKKPKTPKIVEYPQPDGTWLCSEPDCGKRFQSERSLRSHRIVHVRRKKIQAGLVPDKRVKVNATAKTPKPIKTKKAKKQTAKQLQQEMKARAAALSQFRLQQSKLVKDEFGMEWLRERDFCSVCWTGIQAMGNKILYCEGACGRAFHQKCHVPYAVLIPGSWFCGVCAAARNKKKAKDKKKTYQRKSDLASSRSIETYSKMVADGIGHSNALTGQQRAQQMWSSLHGVHSESALVNALLKQGPFDKALPRAELKLEFCSDLLAPVFPGLEARCLPPRGKAYREQWQEQDSFLNRNTPRSARLLKRTVEWVGPAHASASGLLTPVEPGTKLQFPKSSSGSPNDQVDEMQKADKVEMKRTDETRERLSGKTNSTSCGPQNSTIIMMVTAGDSSTKRDESQQHSSTPGSKSESFSYESCCPALGGDPDSGIMELGTTTVAELMADRVLCPGKSRKQEPVRALEDVVAKKQAAERPDYLSQRKQRYMHLPMRLKARRPTLRDSSMPATSVATLRSFSVDSARTLVYSVSGIFPKLNEGIVTTSCRNSADVVSSSFASSSRSSSPSTYRSPSKSKVAPVVFNFPAQPAIFILPPEIYCTEEDRLKEFCIPTKHSNAMSASRAATAMRKEFKADVALECISFHVNSAASFRWARQKRTTIVDQDEQALLAASNAHVKVETSPTVPLIEGGDTIQYLDSIVDSSVVPKMERKYDQLLKDQHMKHMNLLKLQNEAHPRFPKQLQFLRSTKRKIKSHLRKLLAQEKRKLRPPVEESKSTDSAIPMDLGLKTNEDVSNRNQEKTLMPHSSAVPSRSKVFEQVPSNQVFASSSIIAGNKDDSAQTADAPPAKRQKHDESISTSTGNMNEFPALESTNRQSHSGKEVIGHSASSVERGQIKAGGTGVGGGRIETLQADFHRACPIRYGNENSHGQSEWKFETDRMACGFVDIMPPPDCDLAPAEPSTYQPPFSAKKRSTSKCARAAAADLLTRGSTGVPNVKLSLQIPTQVAGTSNSPAVSMFPGAVTSFLSSPQSTSSFSVGSPSSYISADIPAPITLSSPRSSVQTIVSPPSVFQASTAKLPKNMTSAVIATSPPSRSSSYASMIPLGSSITVPSPRQSNSSNLAAVASVPSPRAETTQALTASPSPHLSMVHLLQPATPSTPFTPMSTSAPASTVHSSLLVSPSPPLGTLGRASHLSVDAPSAPSAAGNVLGTPLSWAQPAGGSNPATTTKNESPLPHFEDEQSELENLKQKLLHADVGWAWTPPQPRFGSEIETAEDDSGVDEVASELQALRHELFNQCSSNNARRRRLTRLVLSTGCVAADSIFSGSAQTRKEIESRYRRFKKITANLPKACETVELSGSERDDEFDQEFERKWIESKGKTFMTSRSGKRKKAKLLQKSSDALKTPNSQQQVQANKVKAKHWTPSAEKLIRHRVENCMNQMIQKIEKIEASTSAAASSPASSAADAITSSVVHSSKASASALVCSFCKTGDEPGRLYIQCDECNVWFHGGCPDNPDLRNMTDDMGESTEEYRCSSCRKNTKRPTMSTFKSPDKRTKHSEMRNVGDGVHDLERLVIKLKKGTVASSLKRRRSEPKRFGIRKTESLPCYHVLTVTKGGKMWNTPPLPTTAGNDDGSSQSADAPPAKRQKRGGKMTRSSTSGNKARNTRKSNAKKRGKGWNRKRR